MGKRREPQYVGIDVGGTNITTALTLADGRIIARRRQRTPREGRPQDTLAVIIRTVEELLDQANARAKDLSAIGLGVPGVVEPREGLVVITPNMNLSPLHIVQPMEKHFGVPVALDNDVNLGTLGEHWLGAARGAASAVGIFVGTGIGGGVISDGRLVRGARHAAGEIGHIVMQVGGPLCGCGNRGCLEAIASRSAIERDIRDAVAAGRETMLTQELDGDLSRIRSKPLKRALKAEDPVVTEVMRNASEVIGYACLTVRHLLDPEVIVLGGGVVEACGEFMLPIVEGILADDKLPAAREGGRLVRSELGDDAVVLGAVALALEHTGAELRHPSQDARAPYPYIGDVQFGRVTIGGDVYTRDVYIRANGKVKKRRKKAAKELYGTSHVIGPEELEKVCKGSPEILIIGTGHSGQVSLSAPAEEFLRKNGIAHRAVPTSELAAAYNGAEGRKAALIHVTC